MKIQALATTSQYTVKLHSMANPDYGQYTSISEPEVFIGNSIRDCLKRAMEYQQEWDLGGGNWHAIYIVQNGRKIAEISYNGRLWEPVPYSRSRKEILP